MLTNRNVKAQAKVKLLRRGHTHIKRRTHSIRSISLWTRRHKVTSVTTRKVVRTWIPTDSRLTTSNGPHPNQEARSPISSQPVRIHQTMRKSSTWKQTRQKSSTRWDEVHLSNSEKWTTTCLRALIIHLHEATTRASIIKPLIQRIKSWLTSNKVRKTLNHCSISHERRNHREPSCRSNTTHHHRRTPKRMIL